jgi:hypothetical protein
MADYEKYLSEHATKLMGEHDQKFGGKYAAFRTLLDVVHHVNG